MSVEQDKKIQSLYASLKNVMTQNLDKDEQEQLLEWVHKLLNHHRLKPVGLGWLLKQPKVVRPRSYRSSFVLLNPDF